ncbi:MAG: winged helix DNA-binding protein [Desulfobacteraceae bacterium]|jgi:DNA-binding MarR family transcriptional regulator|nr:winged helix DNA-binding protein [Desulfobacteraceae bacterium]
MIHGLFTNIAKLGTKMRIYRAVQIVDSDAGVLKDREILILELLKTQGSMSMTDLSQFFPGVKQSTLSTDIKKLRTELDLIDMKVDKKDMRIHLIELSDKGLEKINEIKAQRAKSYIPLAEAIGNDPDEIELLNQVVSRAIDLVDREIGVFAESKK